jgi:hypothetical protein
MSSTVPDVLFAYVPPCALRGGRAVGLCGFGRVYAVEPDRHRGPSGPPELEGVPVCDFHDAAGERLPGFYWSALLGFSAALPRGAKPQRECENGRVDRKAKR